MILPSLKIESSLRESCWGIGAFIWLMSRRTEWNSRIAQTPPTVEYKGIMAEDGQGETGVLSVLDKVVGGVPNSVEDSADR
jgi:hypothetical protein